MSGEIVLTDRDGGREVPVSPGDTVVLRLPEVPTTGFRWTLPDGVDVTEDGNRSGDAPGAGGDRELRFTMPDAPLDLHLERRQDWNPDTPDADLKMRLVPRR